MLLQSHHLIDRTALSNCLSSERRQREFTRLRHPNFFAPILRVSARCLRRGFPLAGSTAGASAYTEHRPANIARVWVRWMGCIYTASRQPRAISPFICVFSLKTSQLYIISRENLDDRERQPAWNQRYSHTRALYKGTLKLIFMIISNAFKVQIR